MHDPVSKQQHRTQIRMQRPSRLPVPGKGPMQDGNPQVTVIGAADQRHPESERELGDHVVSSVRTTAPDQLFSGFRHDPQTASIQRRHLPPIRSFEVAGQLSVSAVPEGDLKTLQRCIEGRRCGDVPPIQVDGTAEVSGCLRQIRRETGHRDHFTDPIGLAVHQSAPHRLVGRACYRQGVRPGSPLLRHAARGIAVSQNQDGSLRPIRRLRARTSPSARPGPSPRVAHRSAARLRTRPCSGRRPSGRR